MYSKFSCHSKSPRRKPQGRQDLKWARSPLFFWNSALRCTGHSPDTSVGHLAARTMDVPIASSATYETVFLIFHRDGEDSSLARYDNVVMDLW